MDILIIYKNLLLNHSYYNAWKPANSFPISGINDNELSIIKDYEIVEQVYNGIGDGPRTEVLFLEKISKFKLGMKKEFFDHERKFSYLFAIEHNASKSSKLKSYKGLFDKRLVDKSDYFEFEVTAYSNQTLISFVAEMKDVNFDIFLKFFYDDSISFIIRSNKNYLNNAFLEAVISTINLTGNIQLNYLKLISLFQEEDDIIYRIGGDGGEEYWSVQKFQKKTNTVNG